MARKKQTNTGDWHRAYIIAELSVRGTNLRKLAQEHGYAPNSLYKVFWYPWSQAEKIVGRAIGIPPSEIWPSRYDGNGCPLNAGPTKLKVKPFPSNNK